ncbi:MAG: heparinase II/III domain-containing protein, partial [Armatimonadota bacterium]
VAPAEAWATILEKADRFVEADPYHRSVNMPGREGGPSKLWEYTLSDERPPRHDDYPHYPPTTSLFQERSDSITTRLKYFLVAWVVTGEDRYYEKAREIAFHLCAWEGYWNDPTAGETHAGLDTSHAAIWMGIFYDWCYDRMSEAERETVRTALIEKSLVLLEQATTEGTIYHNITVLKLVGLGIGSIAILDEDERTRGWIDAVLGRLRQNFDAQGEDGGAMEGPMYGNYAAGAIADFLWATQNAGIEHDLFEHRYLQTLPRYCISLLDPSTGQLPCFGDGGPGLAFGHTNLVLALQGDPEAAWYCREIGMFGEPSPRTFIAMDPDRITPQAPDFNPSECFYDVGYAIMRDGFNPDAAFLAFKSGPPEDVIGHNHYDHNSFMLSYRDSWLAWDPGYRDYFHPARRKYTVGTLGHNTVVLDLDQDYLADTSVKLAGHDQMHLSRGRIAEFFTSEAYDYLLGDASDTYNTDDARVLDRFHRQIVYARPNVFFVRDTLATPDEHTFSALMHASANDSLQIEGDAARIISSSALLQIHPFSPQGLSLSQAHYPGAESKGAYMAATTERVAEATILTALVPRPHTRLLVNPDFEMGMVGWTPRGAQGQLPNHVIDTEVAHSGQASARIDNNGYYYSAPLHLPPGSEFTFRWWGKSTGPGAHAIIYHSADGVSVKRVELPGPTSNEWEQFEYTGTVPEGATQTRLALQMFGEGQCWYDDVELVSEVEIPEVMHATVTPIDGGATGAIVEVDGVTHVLLTATDGPVTAEAAGRTIATDAEMAVVSLDGARTRAFMLRGSTLTVDGADVTPVEGEWRSGPLQ